MRGVWAEAIRVERLEQVVQDLLHRVKVLELLVLNEQPKVPRPQPDQEKLL